MIELSFWERESFFNPVDVVVIGSGIVGLNAAWQLKRLHPKLSVRVLERGILPTGASSRNAGFACFGSPTELLSDLQSHTEDQVFGLVEKRWRGLQTLRKNLGDKNIQFKNWGGYELFSEADQNRYEQCTANLSYLNQMVEQAIGEKNVYLPADLKVKQFGFAGVKHLIENRTEGQIHTGKMITTLTRKAQAAGVQVLCNIEVSSLSDTSSGVALQLTSGIEMFARRVIVCTNGFATQLLPDLPVVPARAQVLLTAPIPGLKIKGTFHYDEGYYYFRNIGNRVLFGGARNLDFETEKTTQFGLTPKVQQQLETMLRDVILPGQNFEIEQRWSGIMGMGPERGPIIKAVSPNVVCAVRLGGMGVAIGSLVGQEAAGISYQSL